MKNKRDGEILTIRIGGSGFCLFEALVIEIKIRTAPYQQFEMGLLPLDASNLNGHNPVGIEDGR
ncbi:MAG TPA: hypothetical protein VF326_02675 [Anaerolineaceae bacterium]